MLHLTATDADDLSVISAQMQDAVIRFGDIRFLKKQRRFALVANRFAWDALPEKSRRRAGLVFNDISGVRRLSPKAPGEDTILSLLSIGFTPEAGGDGISGTVTLTFAGGHAFALAAGCVDAQLDDLGPAWGTAFLPGHEDKT